MYETAGDAQGGNGGDEVMYVLSQQMFVKRCGTGVDLVKVETAFYVAGLVCLKGQATWFAADLDDEFEDYFAQLISHSWLGVEDRDHRSRPRSIVIGREAHVPKCFV
jgi:hypothetical protein